MDVQHDGKAYFIGIGGNAESKSCGDRGEWRFIIEKHRSLKEKLTGQSPMSENEDIIGVLRRIVDSEPDMKFLRIE
jgi:hypothetical protein